MTKVKKLYKQLEFIWTVIFANQAAIKGDIPKKNVIPRLYQARNHVHDY